MIKKPFNVKAWIDDNRDLLKPPIGNKCVYEQADDLIVMVVGGPNARRDFHYNEGEELFFQVEGAITLKTVQDEKIVDVVINQGDIFLLPARTLHSPAVRRIPLVSLSKPVEPMGKRMAACGSAKTAMPKSTKSILCSTSPRTLSQS